MKEKQKPTKEQLEVKEKALKEMIEKLLTDNEACIISVRGRKVSSGFISGNAQDVAELHLDNSKRIVEQITKGLLVQAKKDD